jgi:BMFP domain-containing protein YqiC
MGHQDDLELYRSQLLASLNGRSSGSLRAASDTIQVYVNERRVGQLEGGGIGATLHAQCADPIETVQLRMEDGTLLGGMTAPEYGFRTDRVGLSADAVELCVHNTALGGTLNALFVPAPSFWSRAWKNFGDLADRWAVRRPETAPAYGMRTVAFTQALLAVAVVGLVADRTTTWMTPEPAPSQVVYTAALPAAPSAETAQLEQQLEKLSKMQAKIGEVLESQQNGVAQLHQAVAKLSSTQESMASSVVLVKEEVKTEVKEEIEKRLEAVGREADRAARHVASKGRVEHEQLEAAIRSLTADNDRLSKEVVSLEEHNQALKNKLQTAVVSVSKPADPGPERLLKMADSQATQQAPFLFWVTFSEGTSQERIDQWVHEMKGHKGAVSEGWQEVRIVPPPVPPDRFLEQIREEKIVKAARISQ